MPRPKDLDTEAGRARHEHKYERILDAALQVFAAKGFYEARISDIARTAGVADGTIYLYFKSKDDVLISLFETHLEAINRGLRDGLGAIDDAAERIRFVIDYHLRLALENPTLAEFITIELRRSGRFMKRYAKEQFTDYIGQFAQVLDDGRRAGLLRDDFSAGTAAHLLFGALDHACVTWVNNPNRMPEQLGTVGKELTAVVLRGLGARD